MLDTLSDSARLYLKESIPKQLLSALVKGTIPLEPKELLILIAYHFERCDEPLKKEALNTIKTLPPDIIESVVKDDVPDFVLDFIYKNYPLSQNALYSLITNKNLSDNVFIELAKTNDESILELLTKNQMRILKNDKIFDTLITNPHLPKILKDQLMEFFSFVASKELKKLNIESEKKGTVNEQSLQKHVNTPSDLPSELQKAGLPSFIKNADLPADAAMLPSQIEAQLPSERNLELPMDALDNLPTELLREGLPSELIQEQDENLDEGTKLTLYQRIQKMTVSQKIKLALLGNKEARSILLRDSNRIVVESVIKSPRITDGEIISITNSRNISEDILRMIASNREWQKNYRIRHALVSNPKTPVPIALKLLETLSKQDLKNLSNNKNVSTVVATTAKRLVGDNK
ncbi:MAG: hypothetical protein ACP5JP_04430 [bacterium]